MEAVGVDIPRPQLAGAVRQRHRRERVVRHQRHLRAAWGGEIIRAPRPASVAWRIANEPHRGLRVGMIRPPTACWRHPREYVAYVRSEPTYARTSYVRVRTKFSTVVVPGPIDVRVCTRSILYDLAFFCRNLRLQLKLSDLKF